MWEQMNAPDFEADGKSLSDRLKVHIKGSTRYTPL